MKAKLLPSLVCTSVITDVVEGSRVHQSAKLEVPATAPDVSDEGSREPYCTEYCGGERKAQVTYSWRSFTRSKSMVMVTMHAVVFLPGTVRLQCSILARTRIKMGAVQQQRAFVGFTVGGGGGRGSGRRVLRPAIAA